LDGVFRDDGSQNGIKDGSNDGSSLVVMLGTEQALSDGLVEGIDEG
jgi:hypothetical protein